MSTEISPPADLWLLLTRHFAGESSAEERAELDCWIGEDPERQRWVESVRTLLEGSALPMPPIDSRASFERARASLGLEAPRSPVARLRTGGRPPRRVVVGSPLWWRGMVTATAGIALLLVATGVLRHAATSGTLGREYVTSAGQRLTVTLSDGTQMTLAPASRARIARDYGRGTRTVELEGEGYFSVVHNPAHPFAVHISGAVATDVGTAFDVRAYPEDGGARVAVTEGEVALSRTGCVMGACMADVRRGDVAVVGEQGVMVSYRGDVTGFTAWRQGGLVFEDTPLRDVVRDVARTFGVTITVADSALAGKPVTARFAGQPLDFVLNAITQVLGARYERSGDRIVIRKGTASAQDLKTASPPPLTTARAETTRE